MAELPQVPPPRCIHLHSNAMAVHGEGFEDDPSFQDGMADVWCLRTARPIGPDGGDVGLKPCRDPGRGCHQEY
jgi:hypothetical protein